jgi:hypothetical protein
MKSRNFSIICILTAALLAACAAPGLPGETKAESTLENVETRQLSAASASVQAAGQANQANPEGAPKAAVAGELGVAAANLPAANAEDARAALARVNAALAGKLAEAQKGWDEASARGHALDAQVSDLQKQVVAERATAAEAQRKATEHSCVFAALLVGGVLFIGGALSLAAGMYFTLPKLEYGALGLALCAACAFFAATQVGTVHFNVLATVVLAGAVLALAYTVWSGFQGGSTIKAKAGGFDAAMLAVRHFLGDAALDASSDAKKLWHWLGVELDAAHKALVADWEKLDALFTAQAGGSAPTPTAPKS